MTTHSFELSQASGGRICTFVALWSFLALATGTAALAGDPIRQDPHNFRLGVDREASPGRGFNAVSASEIDDIEAPLQEICPCLYIRVVTANVRRALRNL